MYKKNTKRTMILLATFACLSLPYVNGAEPVEVAKGVYVQEGATPIENGMANHKDDFTVINNKIAVSFAAGSNNYWNMTKGSILDIALVDKSGDVGIDLINDIEFLNNMWSASASYDGKDLLHPDRDQITYRKDGDNVIVQADTQYYVDGHDKPLDVKIEYTIKPDSNYIPVKTTVTNTGNDDYKDMYSGYSISTLADSMYGPFGYYPDKKITGIRMGSDLRINEELGNYIVSYGKNYAISVQQDGADAYKGSSGYKDLYTLRDIKAKESYIYTGEILVNNSGSTTPILARYLQKNKEIQSINVKGQVIDKLGKPVPGAYVIISKEGAYVRTPKADETLNSDVVISHKQPLAWHVTNEAGEYEFLLPTGSYEIHAEAAGMTPSQPISISKDDKKLADAKLMLNEGAQIYIRPVDEKGNSIPARITFPEATMGVKTIGSTVYFTNPYDNVANFTFQAIDGNTVIEIDYGKDFFARTAKLEIPLKAGKTYDSQVVIPTLIDINSKHWYSVDNHQHSNIGDGATTPQALFDAQVAAKLDLHVISDHDSINNNKEMFEITNKAGHKFLSSLEVSPGWGHWGILNVPYEGIEGTPIAPTSTPKEINDLAHKMGATVVLNHPYTDYGFYLNRPGVLGGQEEGADDYDLVELQKTINLYGNNNDKNWDKRTLDEVMTKFWNQGIKKYLSAGSDQHDVTSTLYPGIIRMIAYVPGEFNHESYLAALKDGHAYMSMGPIIFPDKDNLFGETIWGYKGEAINLGFDIHSVNGIALVNVIKNGEIVKSVNLDTKDIFTYRLEWKDELEKNGWYNIVVVDTNNNYAVTNPIWVNINN
ncbi:CehA/McbA family metallohydrolase [uncultured Veillonella sp.]|uniref:CehA/McbA family metallohydrolase n=1 Tax=uncultured Veillonella sp. TaxID=159268 RepID=UPI0026170593|nr:CehA/McbA family metallohydrolase [uncultured Veillonella sp.]